MFGENQEHTEHTKSQKTAIKAQATAYGYQRLFALQVETRLLGFIKPNLMSTGNRGNTPQRSAVTFLNIIRAYTFVKTSEVWVTTLVHT